MTGKSTLLSGILAEGLCRKIVETHLLGHTPILSQRLWDELVNVLEEKFGLTPDNLPLLGLYHRLATWVEPSELKPPVCRDSDDDWVLATALAGETETIVTGDDDLLTLRRHRNLAILSPRQFLNPHYSVRRAKALCVSQVQVLSGESSGHPRSYQDGMNG